MENSQVKFDSVSVQELIVSTIGRRGNGTTTPIRAITEIFTKDGIKIAEVDPCKADVEFTEKDVLHFCRWLLKDNMNGPFEITEADIRKWKEEVTNQFLSTATIRQ